MWIILTCVLIGAVFGLATKILEMVGRGVLFATYLQDARVSERRRKAGTIAAIISVTIFMIVVYWSDMLTHIAMQWGN